MPELVQRHLLPHPGTALDHGLGSPEGRRYEADLQPMQFEIWDDLISDAESGFLDVGDALGILPGSG